MVKQGKIKKQQPLPAISEDEKLFELPKWWEWCRIQDVTSYVQRGKSPKYAEEGSVKVISQKCVQNSGFTLEPARFVTDESLNSYQDERFLLNGDLLWNSTGTGTVGRSNCIGGIESKALVADSHVTVIRPLIYSSEFLNFYLMSPSIQIRINPNHENALVSGSTKQVELNTSSVLSLVIPALSENEQHRIVAKVNELMALCDAMKSKLQTKQQTQLSLADALIANSL